MTHREQELFFETLELLRKIAAQLPDFQGADWKDVDDYIFSELQLTQEDVAKLYEDRPEFVFTASCIPGIAPAAPTYQELKPYKDTHRSFTCQVVSHSCWNVVCLVADVPGKPIVLTEADCPELRNYVGEKFILHERERSSVNPAELTFAEWGYTLKAVYTVSEAG